MTSLGTVRLSGRAARYLDMLLDLGHLAPAQVEALLAEAARRFGEGGGEVIVGFSEVRALAAGILFSVDVDAPSGAGPLGEDWPPLFY